LLDLVYVAVAFWLALLLIQISSRPPMPLPVLSLVMLTQSTPKMPLNAHYYTAYGLQHHCFKINHARLPQASHWIISDSRAS